MPNQPMSNNPKTTPELFNVIVGNPPYVNIANISDSNIRKFYQDNYETVKNKSDLYSIFVERGVKLLKEGGYLGFIISNSWLGTDSFAEFRRFLLENTRIIQVIKMSPGVFDDAVVTPAILILKKEVVVGNHEIELVECIDEKFVKMDHTLSYDRIRANEGLTFSFDLEIRFGNPMIRLGDIAKFSLGIKTSNDERFVLDEKKDDNCYPILRGRDIERYYTKKPEKWLWYRPDLMAEKVGSGARKLEFFLKDKILFQTISGGIIKASLSKNNELTNDKLHILYELNDNWKMNYILGIVSTNLMNKWLKSVFGNLLEIKINQLQQLPIPNATAEQQAEIADLVDQIMSLKQDFAKYLDGSFRLLESELSATINRNKKLSQFYTLDFPDFITELEKQKNRPTAAQKRNLLELFDTDKSKLLQLQTKIDAVDSEIESLVQGLYGVGE